MAQVAPHKSRQPLKFEMSEIPKLGRLDLDEVLLKMTTIVIRLP